MDGDGQDRIKELERQRKEELENRRWMASYIGERPNSLGEYGFERNVNKEYDRMISAVRRDADSATRSAIEPVSPDNQSRRRKKRRELGCREEDDAKMGSEFRKSPEEEDDESVESSFSYVSSKSQSGEGGDDDDFIATEGEEKSNGEDEPRAGAKRKKAQDVIEIDDSDPDSDASPDDAPGDAGGNGIAIDNESIAPEGSANEKSGEDIDDSDPDSNSAALQGDGLMAGDGNSIQEKENHQLEDEESNRASSDQYAEREAGSDTPDNHCANDASEAEEEENEMATSDNFFESDDDAAGEDDANGEIERYHVSKIRQSKLAMATQGFRCQVTGRRSPGAETANTSNSTAAVRDATPFDPSSVEYQGATFVKNRCYVLRDDGEVTVGIQRFISNDTAQCVLVEKFDNTLLGIEDEGLEYKADSDMVGTYAQIHKCSESLALAKLERESGEIGEIPDLIYQPQTPGDWHTFGYFYASNKMRRIGKRQGLRSMEFFAGAGGSLIGYKTNGFDTVMAVENSSDAVCTLKANNDGIKVYEGCIRKFIEDYDTLKCALGRIDNIHFSSPCQDFSQANRSQVTGRRDRADLSLLLIDLVRKTECSTAVFENVVGIWQRKNVHYLKNIAVTLLKKGYQVRCTVLRACDYGDPQGRPRFFMFISKRSVPIPSFPAKTHGPDDDHLWPYTTVHDALSRVANNDSLPNMEGRTTQLMPQHGIVRLMPYEVAPTIRASGGTPFHYEEDRCINVRETACLQSFPLDYTFHGTLGSQYRQVGNAVPVELSTAVAQSIRQVLLYEYEEADEE